MGIYQSVNLHETQIAEILKLMGYTETIPYSAIPAALDMNNAAGTQFMTLTGNTTIAAPTGGKVGQRLRYVFKQDGTGGRTITWPSNMKAGANGAGTANQVGATDFVFDGTNWIQVGGVLTFKG